MSRFIEELKSYQNDIDATQIADILWLGKIMGLPIEPPKPTKEYKPEPKIDKIDKVDEEIEETSLKDDSNLPVEVEHEIVISSPKKEQKRRFERQKNNNSIYSAKIEQKERFPNIIKQFSSLQIKQKSFDSSLIDEDKTAKYRAVSGILYPFFKEQKIKKSYYKLLIVIDQNSSMFLWKNQIKHFIKSVNSSNLFKSVVIIKLDSTQNYPSFKKDKSEQNLKSNAPIFGDSESLTLIFTDVVGKSWRSRYMFEVLDGWSKYSFVSIVSMLPKRMWQKTPLRLGTSLFMRSTKFLPKNSDLKAEFDFIGNSVKNSTNIPVIPYNDRAFEYLSNILTAKKDSWIDSRLFEGLTPREITDLQEQEIEASVRVERFFASSPPEARKLAIYCSVLPLNQKVIEEVIRVKALGEDMGAFAEFYFGGLLDKTSQDKSFEFEFHKGVRSELIGLISMEEVVSLFDILDSVIADSFGVNQTMLDLLYGGSEDEILSDKEREFAELLVEVLGEKGVFWEGEVERIQQELDTVYLDENSFQMGSNSSYYEKTVKTTTFDYDFEIGKYPITFEEYDMYCKDTGSKKPNDRGWGRGKRPVVNVSWNDANAYCKWLSKKMDKEYRLPLEAEWEYACRAGTETKWSFGDDENELSKYAWYHLNTKKIKPVGAKLPNPWGLYDMHGNVWEWCTDDWVDSYEYISNNKKNMSGNKVVRGGSWNNYAFNTQSSYRTHGALYVRYYVRGFRIIRTLPKKGVS